MGDYEIGFGRLADPEDEAVSISFDKEFRFSKGSRYQALKQGSEQAVAIAKDQEDVGLNVYQVDELAEFSAYGQSWETPTPRERPAPTPSCSTTARDLR